MAESPKKKAVAKKATKKATKKAVKKTIATKGGSAGDIADFIKGLDKGGMLADITKKINYISTGSWIIDRLIGDGSGEGRPGGIPRGFITELFGDESCGKSTLALHVAAEAQAQGEIVVYVDFEHSLRSQRTYIENLGVDIDPNKFIVITPENYEDGVAKIGEALLKIKPALIILDSLAAAAPKAVMDGSAGDLAQIGLHAKLTASFLNWVNKRLEKSDTALLVLNQKRSNIKASKYDAGPDEVTTGGKAIRFFPSLRIELKPSTKGTVDQVNALTGVKEKKAIDQTVKCVIVKNKIDKPWMSSPIYITYGKGIDGIKSLIKLAVAKGVIKKGGAWFEYIDPVDESRSFKRQGENQVWKKLIENPDTVKALYPMLMPELDTEEYLAAKKTNQIAEDDLEHLDDEDKNALAELDELTNGLGAANDAANESLEIDPDL